MPRSPGRRKKQRSPHCPPDTCLHGPAANWVRRFDARASRTIGSNRGRARKGDKRSRAAVGSGRTEHGVLAIFQSPAHVVIVLEAVAVNLRREVGIEIGSFRFFHAGVVA